MALGLPEIASSLPAGKEVAPIRLSSLTVAKKMGSSSQRKQQQVRISKRAKKQNRRGFPPRSSGPLRPVPDPECWDLCNRVMRVIQKTTTGISGNTVGIDGSINAASTACVLRSLRAKGRSFVDFGSGFGWMMAAAYVGGSNRYAGYELPENHPQRRIYRHVIRMLQLLKVGCATALQFLEEFYLHDINKVFCCPFFGTSHYRDF